MWAMAPQDFFDKQARKRVETYGRAIGCAVRETPRSTCSVGQGMHVITVGHRLKRIRPM